MTKILQDIWDGLLYGLQDPECWWLTLLVINIGIVLAH